MTLTLHHIEDEIVVVNAGVNALDVAADVVAVSFEQNKMHIRNYFLLYYIILYYVILHSILLYSLILYLCA